MKLGPREASLEKLQELADAVHAAARALQAAGNIATAYGLRVDLDVSPADMKDAGPQVKSDVYLPMGRKW